MQRLSGYRVSPGEGPVKTRNLYPTKSYRSVPKSIIVFGVPTARDFPNWVAVLRDGMGARSSMEDIESPRKHGGWNIWTPRPLVREPSGRDDA
jgi:hypothetical protein